MPRDGEPACLGFEGQSPKRNRIGRAPTDARPLTVLCETAADTVLNQGPDNKIIGCQEVDAP